MTKLDRLLAKPHKFFLWAFTGLIVASTAYTLWEPYTIKKSITDKQSKRKKSQPPKTPEEIERDAKDVSNWTRKELFDYLTRVSTKGCVKDKHILTTLKQHQVYPDVEVDRAELVKLVKSIKNLYPDIDF